MSQRVDLWQRVEGNIDLHRCSGSRTVTLLTVTFTTCHSGVNYSYPKTFDTVVTCFSSINCRTTDYKGNFSVNGPWIVEFTSRWHTLKDSKGMFLDEQEVEKRKEEGWRTFYVYTTTRSKKQNRQLLSCSLSSSRPGIPFHQMGGVRWTDGDLIKFSFFIWRYNKLCNIKIQGNNVVTSVMWLFMSIFWIFSTI